MAYSIYHTRRFQKDLGKADNTFKQWLNQTEEQLSLNPYNGKPLDAEWFREKKFGVYRVYFLIYEEYSAVYVVALSDKKDQQKVINTIRLLLNLYDEEIKNILKIT